MLFVVVLFSFGYNRVYERGVIMTDRELLEFIAAQVGNLTQKVDKIDERTGSLEEGQKRIEKVVTNIEHDYGQKLKALFDGYKQHTDILERIEKEVTKQEEIIMRRIK